MTKLDLVKQAHAEQLALVNNTRCTQIQQHVDYEGIGGKENIENSVLTVVRKFPDGVRNEHLKTVFPDGELAKARTSLMAKGLITQIGKRGEDVTLKPVMTAAGAEIGK
jgi:hypothetical protein